MLIEVERPKLERVRKFISVCEGGALGDALMSLMVAYEQRGARIKRLEEKLSRRLDPEPDDFC